MTPEARLDRLERIAKLFVTAGLRARRNMRHLDEKLTILVDAQITNEGRFAAVVESNEKRFAALAEAQIQTDRRLNVLIDIVQGRNGKP